MRKDERLRQAEALRRAVLAGDATAWRTLYDSAYEQLWAYVVWRCAGMRDLAEEITQETWLVAVRRMRAFDPRKGPFLAWLRGIAANALLNHVRSRRRLQSLAATDEAEPARDRDTAGLIVRALAELPEHYEAVLREKYLEGRRVEAIAAAWNATPKAIESLLTRARRAFREVYAKLEGNDIPTRQMQP
jgi:RNA polymerase sigma-70 factor (ECF subfamily)